MKEQHKHYEKQLAEDARKALAEVTDEGRDAAEAAHHQLFSWLVGFDAATKNAASLVSDAMVSSALDALEAELESETEAFNSLSDEKKMEALGRAMAHMLSQACAGATLLSRQGPGASWEPTGFHYDGDLQCVFAKVGQHPYQAIGFADGQKYVATEGSKALWIREFALAPLVRYAPAFTIDRSELGPQEESDATRLSDAERTRIEDSIKDLEEEMDAHLKLPFTVDDVEGESEGDKAKRERRLGAQRANLEWRMRETVKLTRIKVPRLDTVLSQQFEDNPELGQNLENVEAFELCRACREFLSMKLEDDRIRRELEATTVQVGTAEAGSQLLHKTLRDNLEAVLETGDVKALEDAVNATRLACSELQETYENCVENSVGVEECARELLAQLAQLT